MIGGWWRRLRVRVWGLTCSGWQRGGGATSTTGMAGGGDIGGEVEACMLDVEDGGSQREIEDKGGLG
jgi:hypothetical protein